jgi:hypothetical protein
LVVLVWFAVGSTRSRSAVCGLVRLDYTAFWFVYVYVLRFAVGYAVLHTVACGLLFILVDSGLFFSSSRLYLRIWIPVLVYAWFMVTADFIRVCRCPAARWLIGWPQPQPLWLIAFSLGSLRCWVD